MDRNRIILLVALIAVLVGAGAYYAWNRFVAGVETAVTEGVEAAGEEIQRQLDSAATEVEDSIARARSQGLAREVFTYRGGERDPFLSLVRPGGADRPRPTDIRVTSILYDATYPVRSVAVVRDTTSNERHELRVDDVLGRFRVAEIRPTELVVSVEEFGTERQVVLPLRSRQEVRP